MTAAHIMKLAKVGLLPHLVMCIEHELVIFVEDGLELLARKGAVAEAADLVEMPGKYPSGNRPWGVLVSCPPCVCSWAATTRWTSSV